MAFGDYATLLSSFTGADENPLSEGGNWARLDTNGTGTLQRVSNTVGDTQATTRDAYWTPTNFGPDCEAYVSIPTKPGNTQSVSIVARVQGEGGAGTWDGYRATFTAASGTDTWLLDRITNNAAAATIASGNREFSAGEKIGIECIGTTIAIYVFTGGSWTQLGSGTDSTYTSAGKVGMRIANSTARLDDFFAGNVTASFVPKVMVF